MALDEGRLIATAKPYFDNCRAGDFSHALRVVKWVKELGRSRKDLDILIIAAYLHDIGWSGVIPKGKIDFDEMLKYEAKANKNTAKFVRQVLKKLRFGDVKIKSVISLIKAADNHESHNQTEAILVDADNLSKLNIDHLREKYQPASYEKLLKIWEDELSKQIRTVKGKEIYPKLLKKLKDELRPFKKDAPKTKIHATSRGSRWLYVFLFGVVGLLSGLAFLMWPNVNIVVFPQVQSFNINLLLKIDLDVKDMLVPLKIIPGTFIAPDSLEKQNSDRFYYDIDGGKLSFKKNQVSTLINESIKENLGTDYSLIKSSLRITKLELQPYPSGRSFGLPLVVNFEAYHSFPVDKWQEYISGMNKQEAEGWLKKQPGVDTISLEFFPSFFAKVSQKIPINSSHLTFSLDINGKTSILEKHFK